MKKMFQEYYPFTEKEIEEIIEEALFIVDTNVLINLYEYKKDTRNKLLSVLRGLGDQLWIPYWVGYEFHEERSRKIDAQKDAYQILIDKLKSFEGDIHQNFGNHPVLDIEPFCRGIEDIITKVKRAKTRHRVWFESDKILDEVTSIFENKVGSPFSSKELDDIKKEGEERYLKFIPPGFNDNGKDDPKGLRKYGDLIIWKEIIRKASEDEKKPIIFVTGDEKSDWWLLNNKKQKMGARPELKKEILDEAGVKFYMYSTDNFIRFIGEKNNLSFDKNTMEEIIKINEGKDEDTGLVASSDVVSDIAETGLESNN